MKQLEVVKTRALGAKAANFLIGQLCVEEIKQNCGLTQPQKQNMWQELCLFEVFYPEWSRVT